MLAQDTSGHDGWVYTRVWVIDESRDNTKAFVAGMASCQRASKSAEPERPCGCAHSAAGLPVALAAGVLGIRRREPRERRW